MCCSSSFQAPPTCEVARNRERSTRSKYAVTEEAEVGCAWVGCDEHPTSGTSIVKRRPAVSVRCSLVLDQSEDVAVRVGETGHQAAAADVVWRLLHGGAG